jgi:Ca2+-binding RTX toxin-like protein
MSAVYLTTLGALWAGSGININAVEVGEDGWIYMAGIDQSNRPNALNVLAYKDGELAWSKAFRQDGIGAFYALKYINGSVYAAGEIAVNFNGADLAVDGGTPVLPPPGKPDVDPVLAALYPVHYRGPTYPVYVQLEAETGALTLANVLPSPNVQTNDTLRAIDVDSLGNVYVGGGGWNPGPDPTDDFNGASFFFRASKFSDSGIQQWESDGERVVIDPYTDTPSLFRNGDQIVTVDPITGDVSDTFRITAGYVAGGVGSWSRGWIYDEDGNIYFLASRWNQAHTIQYGTVTKFDQVTGNIVWATDIGIGSEYCMPNSLVFDPSGNLLVGGMSRGTLEGKAGFGGSDGFMMSIDKTSGAIISTEVVGGVGNESIEQIAFQPVYDLDGTLVDHNLIIGGSFAVGRYSLEGRDQKDIYVITDQGFELMGNDMDNYMQGGGGSDSIAGGVGDDTLVGGSGNDSVAGGVGKDLIVAGDGAGDDVYDGGLGIDTVRYTSATAGITVNLSAARDQARSTSADLAGIGVDQLSSIENIIAGYYDDILTGSAADNVFAGMTGNDVIDGGAGVDTVEIGSLFADVTGVALAAGGLGVIVTSVEGRDSMLNVERIKFLDAEYTPDQLFDLKPLSFEFSMVTNGVSSGLRPTFFTGPASLNLHYQIIDTTPGAIIAGSALNDFIVLQGGGNKAVNGGLGNDVIDGGTGSTFVSGGGGSNTFFLDGRASGVSWSTITDFQFGQDKATIWGWKEGVSRVKEVAENGGAAGYSGLTLHFENLLPDGSASSARNANLNSITFSSKSLSDFGAESVAELNQQIIEGSNSHFIVGATNDVYGEHGYLYIS